MGRKVHESAVGNVHVIDMLNTLFATNQKQFYQELVI